MINRIRKVSVTALGVAAVSMTVGCSSQGLSSREQGMQNYSNVMYQNQQTPAQTAGPATVQTPARVTVVQIGEITPPESMLKDLRSHRELFRQVSTQSGILPVNEKQYGESQQVEAQPQTDYLTHLRGMAAETGSDYVLIFGGNIDSGSQGTPLSILDLTIVGAFVVPSHVVAVSGKAAGSLVDVHTGRVLRTFSADTDGHGMVPSTLVENSETSSVQTAKSELVKNLTTDVIAQLTDENKPALTSAITK
jgi:hypothetical protein